MASFAACASRPPGQADSIQDRIATLQDRFPLAADIYYQRYKRSHPPAIVLDWYRRYHANGEVVLIDGKRLAIRFDPGAPSPTFGTNLVSLSVFQGGEYKGEFLAVETWKGYALGFLVGSVSGKTIRPGDRVAYLQD